MASTDRLRAALSRASEAVAADAANARGPMPEFVRVAQLYESSVNLLDVVLGENGLPPNTKATCASKRREYAARAAELRAKALNDVADSSSRSFGNDETNGKVQVNTGIFELPPLPSICPRLTFDEAAAAAASLCGAGKAQDESGFLGNAILCYDKAGDYAAAAANALGGDAARLALLEQRVSAFAQRAEEIKSEHPALLASSVTSSAIEVLDAGGKCTLCGRDIPLDHRYAQHDFKNYHLTCVNAVQNTRLEVSKQFLLGGNVYFSVHLERRWFKPGENISVHITIRNSSSHKVRSVKGTLVRIEVATEVLATGERKRSERKFKDVKHEFTGKSATRGVLWPLVQGSSEFEEEWTLPLDLLCSLTPTTAFHREHLLVFKLDMAARHGKPPRVEFPANILKEFVY